MYKNYIFDLYGTLIDINTKEWEIDVWIKMQELYGFYGANYKTKELNDEYDRLVKIEEDKLTQFDYPEIKIENIFLLLFKNKGIEVSIDTCKIISKFFRIISTKHIKLYDGVIDLLKKLKENNKKIYLLSNAQQVFTEDEMKYLGIYDYFDGIVFSSDERCKKPSKKFYDTILKRYNLCKEESIMIGNDWKTDIKGAINAGLDTLYIHTNISPKDTILSEVNANYLVKDGDFSKIGKLIM